MRVLLALISICTAALGCSKQPPKAAAHERVAAAQPEDAPTIRVHPESKDLVYRFFPAGSRQADLATRIDKVPSSARDVVIVVPDVEVPAGLVYVADLREAGPDGSYPYKVVLSADLDRTLDQTRGDPPKSEPTAAAAAPAKPAAAPKAGDEIILYSTSWCGVCKQAARWLRNKGLPFVEKDIEKERGAREEMVQKATAAGVPKSRLNGVPIIYVNGKVLTGFDPRAIENLLKS